MVVASIWSWVTRMVVTPVRRCSALDLAAHRQPERGVEVGERLVEQEQLRRLDQRPGQRHALLLAARELVGHRSSSPRPGPGPRPRPAPGPLLARRLLEAEREEDVLAHRHVRVERIGLEDDADVAVLGLDLVDEGAVEADLAAARLIDAGEHEGASSTCRSRTGPSRRRTRRPRSGAFRCSSDQPRPSASPDSDPRHAAHAADSIAAHQPLIPPIDICIR